MENKLNVVEFINTNNQIEIKNFEAVKSTIEKELNKSYKVAVIQSMDDYKAQKQTRAELNKISKEINDNKIAWVNDLTLKVKEQTKEICELINAKSKEFDTSIKQYEDAINESLGNKKKEAVKYEVNIKFTNKEDLDNFLKKLPKKYSYTIKEK